MSDIDIIGCLTVQVDDLNKENARLKAEVERLRASSFVTAVPVEEYEKLKAEVERLQAELKFSEHRMIALAEALADTRMGYQKEIEILKKGHTNPKRDQGTKKTDNKGKPSRPGVDGKIVRHKPSKGRGTY